MWKRMSGIFVAVVMFFCFVIPISASDGGEVVPTTAAGALVLNTPYAVVMEATTGKVLYASNENEKKAPASVTKIMTMLLVFEQIEQGKLKMEDVVTASEHAKEMGGTQINLDVGEQMSVHDLLMSVAVASANDSAVALAEHIGGSESGFVRMMNEKASELGMQNTTFMNPHGLPTDGHVTTPYDIALMTRCLISFPQSREFIGTKIYPIRSGEDEYKMKNTNALLWSYNGCIGGKTGYTDEAGYCMSVAAERDGFTAISVVMGEKTSKERTADLETLLDYGFGNYDLFAIPIEPIDAKPIPVLRGETEKVQISIPKIEVASQVVPKGTTPKVTQTTKIAEELTAPVSKGEVVGTVKFTLDEKEIATYELTVKQGSKRRTFTRSFGIIIKNIIGS